MSRIIASIKKISAGNERMLGSVMFACLSLVASRVPKELHSYLDVARQYWIEGTAAEGELETAFNEYGKELWSRKDIFGFMTPETCAARAAYCVMLPIAPESVDQLLEFFVEILRRALADWSDESFFENVGAILADATSAH